MSGLLLLRRRLYQGCHSSRLNQIRHYALIGKPSQSQKPTWSLPDSPARTRFAPSPTGYLHLGSLRTALFNYLLAQATGGQFIIRLEDTDQTRFVEDAEQRLYQDLTWAGLSWDEGPDRGGPYGPYKQSDRLDLYRQHASMLLERDHAFRCFCSKEELEFNLKQSTSSGATAHYPGTCTGISQAESDRRAANGEPHTIRFKSSETPVSAPDLVYGAYKKAEREDNFIIMKSDGYPTYHFANVVDDHFMKITHVIRGAEWLISTPKHVELYNAFGWQPPNFAHVGLLVDQQRQKLSKRDIDNIGISVFRDMKILPEALLNFSVLLGWDPGLQNKPHLDKRGRLTLDEMKQNFTTKFTRGDIVVDLVKLKYFQNRFIRDLISGEVADPPALANRILKPIQAELQRLNEKLLTHKPRNKTPGSVLPAGMDELDFDHLSTRMDLAFEETYIHAVLKAWKGPIDDHSQFIRDNMYAFWSPSKPAYKDSFADLQEGMRRIVIRKPTRSLGNTDISKVIIHLRNRLALIPHDEWTLEAVGNRAKELADAVEYYDTKKEQVMNHGAGWKFFRWALFNGMSGLSVVPMMLILGREETLQRLREARRVAARREEVALNSMKEKMQELKDSRVRIAYLGNPEKEDTKGFQEAEVMEARNVKVAIKKDDPEETISDTEHFLRAMHEARPDQGPFPSQVPKREYTLNASPPVQFLNRTEFKSGYRSLLHGTNSEGQYAPPLWHVAESRKEYVLSRMEEETVFSRRRPNELGPFGSGELGPQQHEVAERRFFPPTRGPMLRPKHLDGSEPENTLIPPRRLSGPPGPPGPPGPRGPYLPAGGEPVADYRTHVEEIRARNQENKIKSDKKLRRDRCKQMKPDYRLEPLGSIPRDMVAPGPGPFYAGSVVDHPLRPPFPNRAVHAKAAENERRVRQDMDKKSKVSLAEAERNLQRSWLERGNQ